MATVADSLVFKFSKTLWTLMLVVFAVQCCTAAWGQSLPVPREETVVLEDPAVFTVFDSFNNRIPQGNEFANGYQQIGQEYLFLANFTTGEIEPWLATSYKYNNDYTELTVKLRDDVTWNDGEPFTADDVVFTYQTVMKEDKLGGIAYREQIKNVSAPDKKTVKLIFNQPEPRFIYGLYGQVTGFTIWPKHIWEGEDPVTFKNNPPVTTAAYNLKQVIPALRMFIWERNETYWDKSERFPEAKYIVIRTAPSSPDADLQELITNTIDVGRNVQWFQVELAQQNDPTVSATVFQDPCPRVVSVNTQRKPFDDPKFRWALSYAIDREKIATVIAQPTTVPATHPWSDYDLLNRFTYPDILEKYPLTYDVERANQMLDDLGYTMDANGVRTGPDGKPLEYTLLTVDQVGTVPYEQAQEIAAGIKQIGINLTVRNLAAAAYDDALATGKFDIVSNWHCGAMIDAIDTYNQFTFSLPGQVEPVEGERTPGAYTWSSLKNPEFDKVVAQLQRINPDDRQADALYKQALELWMQGLPVIPVIQQAYFMPWSEKTWTGWPKEGNLYTVPFSWWATFNKVPFELKRAGSE